jgi:hypothetical protein
MLNDAHCHFFSEVFFAALGGGRPDGDVSARLGWDAPGPAETLADRWVAELDRAGVGRAALMASVPGDAASVAAAVRRHPQRFVGFAMVNPAAPGSADAALDAGGIRTLCLFPALHGYRLSDPPVRALFETAASRPGTAVFVHCGVLSIGVRKRLGLPNSFDARLGQPLDLQPLAAAFPAVPVIVPHFGAGFLREALMLADVCPNVVFDTSSSNNWMRYHPGLTLRAVFEQALDIAGPARLMFGSDSSFFPRGWVKDVYDRQTMLLDDIGAGEADRQQILGGTFDRLFPPAWPAQDE